MSEQSAEAAIQQAVAGARAEMLGAIRDLVRKEILTTGLSDYKLVLIADALSDFEDRRAKEWLATRDEQVEARARLAEHDFLCVPCMSAVRANAPRQRCGRAAEFEAAARPFPQD